MTADWVKKTVQGLVPTLIFQFQLILEFLWSCVIPRDGILLLFNVTLGSKATLIYLNISFSAFNTKTEL